MLYGNENKKIVQTDEEYDEHIYSGKADCGKTVEAFQGLRDCAGRGVEIDFDLSISFLAEMVGAKRETVSRQVKALTNRGLIEVHKKRFLSKTGSV